MRRKVLLAGLRGTSLEKATAVSVAAVVSSVAGTEGNGLLRVREPSGLGTRPRDL